VRGLSIVAAVALKIGDKRELELAAWCDPKRVKLIPTTRYSDKLFLGGANDRALSELPRCAMISTWATYLQLRVERSAGVKPELMTE
jgi:hypothetical protein